MKNQEYWRDRLFILTPLISSPQCTHQCSNHRRQWSPDSARPSKPEEIKDQIIASYLPSEALSSGSFFPLKSLISLDSERRNNMKRQNNGFILSPVVHLLQHWGTAVQYQPIRYLPLPEWGNPEGSWQSMKLPEPTTFIFLNSLYFQWSS